MAEFIYRSRIYGPYTFTVEDAGGTVMLEGKELGAFGGYRSPGSTTPPLRADAASLESAARRWWKHRTQWLSSFGHRTNGMVP